MTRRRCPECGSVVVVSERLSQQDNGMDIGCANTQDHEDSEVLVMWEVDEDA